MSNTNTIETIEFDPVVLESNSTTGELLHSAENDADTLYTWDYMKGKYAQLDRLYEKAKREQWNGQTDLPWDTEVNQEKAADISYRENGGMGDLIDFSRTGISKWGDKEWRQFIIENQNWSVSQFLHGEQGALVCTAKIVETVPWIDAKYYAATQVVDEARHVEVFSKYLDEKLGEPYPINPHLRSLLDDIIKDSRWDMTYLGMQIMIEGLALAAFSLAHKSTDDPLFKQLLRYVMRDEARHVAFGVLSLKEAYADMTEKELLDRQEFAYEAAIRMRDRFLQQEVWEKMGADTEEIIPIIYNHPVRLEFQHVLFSKIVPNLKKLGLLDAGSGWLRQKFTDMDIIQYEDMEDAEAII